MTAVRSLINTMLKDQARYCNHCGENYVKELYPCCEEARAGNHAVGRHIDHCRGVIKDNKRLRQSRLNRYGSTGDKSLRWTLALPPKFLMELEMMWKKIDNGNKLFENQKDVRDFMREFPAFKVCEVI